MSSYTGLPPFLQQILDAQQNGQTPTQPPATGEPASPRPPRLPPFAAVFGNTNITSTGLFLEMMRQWYRAAGDNLPDGVPDLRDVTRQVRRTGVVPSVVAAMRDEVSRTGRQDLRIDRLADNQREFDRRRFMPRSYDWINKGGTGIAITT